MRLLFISQLFDPEYSIKGLAFLQDIKARGVDVEVITTFPNYPTGKVFDGYRVKLWQVENINGLRIIRVYSYISHSKSKWARAASYLSFMMSAFLASFFVKKINVIYAYHPQLTIGLVATVLKWIRRVPFITDVQDLWPDALAATQLQKGNLLYKSLTILCNLVYRQASHIIVLSHGYRAALIERGISPEKITVIYNWHADEEAFVSTDTSSLLPENYKYHFVYAGNLGAAQSLSPVIEAFATLNDQSVAFVIIGSGVEHDNLVQRAKSLSAKNVFFLGYIPSKNIKAYLAQADVLVVHLRDEPLFKITIPSKIQASLNTAKPILMAVGGEANQIVLDANAGAVALPNNPASIIDAVNTLLQQSEQWAEMGMNGRLYYQAHMTRKIGVERVAQILKNMTK